MNMTKLSSMLAIATLLAAPAVAQTDPTPQKSIKVTYTVPQPPAKIGFDFDSSGLNILEHDLTSNAGKTEFKIPAYLAGTFSVNSTNGGMVHEANNEKKIDYTIGYTGGASLLTASTTMSPAAILTLDGTTNNAETKFELEFTALTVGGETPGKYEDTLVLSFVGS